MSGHSKWAKIKHKKGAQDQKRGSLFTKLGKAVTLAAKQGGGDPEMNFSLRLAVDKAKSANMPNDNIQRAIKRGTGEGEGGTLEQTSYEGFLPHQIPIIIECLTDNKNRTVAEVKHILEKNGGSMAGPGAVMWMFDKKGVLTVDKQNTSGDPDELELQLIDAGAEDIQEDDEKTTIYTKPEELQKVKDNLEKYNLEVDSAGIEFVAKEKKEIDEVVGEKLENIFDLLDENDDVNEYYTNLA